MSFFSNVKDVLFGKDKTKQVRVRDPEPQGLTTLRNTLSDKIYQGLESYTPNWGLAQDTANNALQQQNHLLTLLPDSLNQSDRLLNQMTGVVSTGKIPTAMTDNMNASVNNALKSSMGDLLNNLAARGVLNSSVTSSGINNLSDSAANAYSQNYLNAYNSVLSGYGSALQGAQNNTNTLMSSINAIGQIPTQAYAGATAGLTPAMSMWQNWQNSYDGRTDYDTVVTHKKGLLDACITGDTLITLSNGQKIPVSELHDNDEIAIWNFDKGCITYTHLTGFYKNTLDDGVDVIRVVFDDGSNVGVIVEHLFFDMTLGKFIAINSDNQDFVGHEFAKVNDEGKVIPVKVAKIYRDGKATETYGPQAEGYWNYLVSGFISGNDGQLGMCNQFDFDNEHMCYELDKKENDLLRYGRLGYEIFKGIMSEEFFSKNRIDECSVAIGKGLTTLDYLKTYFGKFTKYFLV